MRAADAYYWFTLWPRKQLIAYAEAAWHLTIRYGERDDWIVHISVMEHPLDCVCVCVCVVVQWSVYHHYSAGMLLFSFGFFHWNLQLTQRSPRCYYFMIQVFMALNWPFSKVIQNVTAINIRVVFLTSSLHTSLSMTLNILSCLYHLCHLKTEKSWTLDDVVSYRFVGRTLTRHTFTRSMPRIYKNTSWHPSSHIQPALDYVGKQQCAWKWKGSLGLF